MLPFALAALGVVVVGAVAAAMLVARSGGTTTLRSSPPPTSASPSPSAPSAIVAPVVDLAADASAFAVTLTWLQPDGVTPVDGYGIYRDGEPLISLTGPASSYTDTTVVPGQTYAYEVEARWRGSSAQRTAVSVETPVPKLAKARVEGDFSVKVKVISQTGFETFTSSYTLGWHFEPTCDSGPCKVVWTDLADDSLKATLKRKGATYTGSDTGKFNVKCGDTKVKSTLAVSFDVTKAKGIDGEWRATKLKGTLTQTEAAQLGCVASEAVLSITVTLAT